MLHSLEDAVWNPHEDHYAACLAETCGEAAGLPNGQHLLQAESTNQMCQGRTEKASFVAAQATAQRNPTEGHMENRMSFLMSQNEIQLN